MKSINHSYLSRLDHLRFFATVLVIFYHCRGNITYSGYIKSATDIASMWINLGSTGVSLFLVLSGFLFCVISDGGAKDIQYGKFIKNRILRIAPLATLFVFIAICINQNGSTPIDILRILTLQLNTGGNGTGWGNDLYPMGPIWTIAVEFQFYLIFPFLAIFMHRNGVKNIIGIIFILILIKISLVIFNGEHVYYRLYHSIIGRLDQLLIGMIAGHFYLKGYFKGEKLVPTLMIVASIVGISVFMYVHYKMIKQFIPLSFTIEAILWSLMIYGYITLGVRINHRFDALLAYLGGLSFSMYLFHLAVIKALRMTVLPTASSHIETVVIIAFAIIPATILVSALSYKYIEKPFLQLRVKYTK